MSGHAHGNLSAAQSHNPPFPTAIIYNQSKHSCQSVLADIRAVWGSKIRVLQVCEAGLHALPGMDGAIFLTGKGAWGDMVHFQDRLDRACTLDHELDLQRKNGQIVFMPGWSAFAESPESAVAVTAMGLVWPGTEPVASGKLEKIGFKQICQKVGAPTPPFIVLSEEGPSQNLGDPATKENVVQEYMAAVAKMNSTQKGLIKSIHGGGGKGTAHLDDPSDPVQVRAAVEKVLNEMGRSDGIYFEEKVNTKGDGRFYQLEIEVDGEDVAHGGRFVWFNSRLQKVVEIGLSDEHIELFMPRDLYDKSRQWSADIAKEAKNNTRATMEALVFQDETGEFQLQFIECNRRPQVENEALALLQQDSSGNRRYTFAELMMRAAGNPAPDFHPADNVNVVLHARILHGNPDSEGNITYQPGNVLGMSGPRLDYVASEALAPGEISFTSDPQLGKAVICASSWEEMCDRAVEYFQLRRPQIQGPSSTYAQTMQNLFSSAKFRAGQIASNETFGTLDIPEFPTRSIDDILNDQVTPVLINGYRPGEGIDADRWPTPTVCQNVETIQAAFGQQQPIETPFSQYARGELSHEAYIDSLRAQLDTQGGAWVTVAPRDTAQQGNDSESGGVAELGARNAELYAQRAGCVGYETGGAQYQAALIRGFDPAMVLKLGLPYNMPAHSLQRSQYVNGLAELTSPIRNSLFKANAELIVDHYGSSTSEPVPWFPYNFHAGNFYDPVRDYSPQDDTSGELLSAGITPMPNWIFSPHFPLEELSRWTHRQINLFEAHNRVLHMIRIKNPGHGLDWTPDAVWAHVQAIRAVFRERGLQEPIVYIHNHDFNGLGGHLARDVLLRGQADGYNNLVFDGAYRKNGTHNDNTVLAAGLQLAPEQREALIEYNHIQQCIENVLCRFDSRTSQMTPWDSDWAGGTEGSDLRIAKEYGLDPRQINHAKEVASAVFPLERAVTPFSEYKLRLGIAIMIEADLQPKTADAVRQFVADGGRLKVGADVLVGLHRWETLVPRPPAVDQLLSNMSDELETALGQSSKLIDDSVLPAHFNSAQRYTALGFQAKGLEFCKLQAEGRDLTPLLLAPQLLHRQPRTLPMNTRFPLLVDGKKVKVNFLGFGKAPDGDITVKYIHAGQTIYGAHADPDAVIGAATTDKKRKATPGNKHELATVVPGEVISYAVKVGDILKEGEPMCVLESMKMEVKLSVPKEMDGFKVKSLPCSGRTAELQGDILAPGDLLIETEDA